MVDCFVFCWCIFCCHGSVFMNSFILCIDILFVMQFKSLWISFLACLSCLCCSLFFVSSSSYVGHLPYLLQEPVCGSFVPGIMYLIGFPQPHVSGIGVMVLMWSLVYCFCCSG